MRQAVVILTILAVAATSACAADTTGNPSRLIITIDAGEGVLRYQWDRQLLNADQGVQIRLQVEGRPQQTVLIRARQVAGSLKSGKLTAQEGVTVGTPQGVLTGSRLSLNAETDEFSLKEAQAAVDLSPEQSGSLLGYAFGEEIGRRGEVVYVLRGKITTSDCRTPEYSLTARRIEYYPAANRFKIKGAAVELYGVRIPLVPSFSFTVGGEEKEAPPLIPVPSYSSRDKLFLPYRFSFSGPQADLQSNLTIKLTQSRGIRARSENVYTGADWLAQGVATQAEDYYTELGDHLILDRRPQLQYTKFSAGPDQESGWAGSVTLANLIEDLKEDDDDPTPRPTVREQSLQLGLRYDWRSAPADAEKSQWYSLAGRQSFYSTGDNYRDLALTAGASRRISKNFKGALSLTHHIPGGQTPFLYDRVDIRTELQPTVGLRMSPKWSVRADGRYDVGRGKLRDYEVELRRRAHALTWALRYRFIGNSLGIGVYITGLTGDTEPYEQSHPLNDLYDEMQQELAEPTGQ